MPSLKSHAFAICLKTRTYIFRHCLDVFQFLKEGKVSLQDAQRITRFEPEERQAILERIAKGESAMDAVRETKRAEIRAKLDDIAAQEIKAVQGVFDVIVIDPPWKMKKIEWDNIPGEVEWDYNTMSEEELCKLHVPAADDCHVWLWATHRHLPMAFRLLIEWGFEYVCTFVWHKNGGYQQFGRPQYNCEFALYAKKGNPQFVDIKGFSTCFTAPRGKHSEKPEAFYDVVRRVTAGRRLDMFNRRKIDGFFGWGNESPYNRESLSDSPPGDATADTGLAPGTGNDRANNRRLAVPPPISIPVWSSEVIPTLLRPPIGA